MKIKFRTPKTQIQQIADATPEDFWEKPTVDKVIEKVRIIKEDDDGGDRLVTDIYIGDDSTPNSILHSIKENAKTGASKWDRVICQYIVNEDIRDSIEINSKSSTKLIEEVEMLSRFIKFVMGHDD